MAAPSSMGSWGEKMRASPQGDVLMYKWNCTESFSLKPPRSECWKMDFFWLSLLLPGSIVWVSECPKCPGSTRPALSLAEEAGTGLGHRLECKHESHFFRTGCEARTRVPCPARFLQWVEGRVGTRALRTHAPQGQLELGIEEPEQRAAGDDLGVAVVERQAPVTHVLAVDALGARGHTDHFGVLHVRACAGTRLAPSSAPHVAPSLPDTGGGHRWGHGWTGLSLQQVGPGGWGARIECSVVPVTVPIRTTGGVQATPQQAWRPTWCTGARSGAVRGYTRGWQRAPGPTCRKGTAAGSCVHRLDDASAPPGHAETGHG